MPAEQHDRQQSAGASAAGVDDSCLVLAVLHSSDTARQGAVVDVGDGLTIGRVDEKGVDLAIDDRLLSRRHASVSPLDRAGLYELVDHDSRNGSFVDGVRTGRSQLTDGSIVRLGVTVFELTRRAAGPSDPSAGSATPGDAFLGHSASFVQALGRIDELADRSGPVIFVGERGTGKKSAARRLHRRSGREGGLVVAHCDSVHSAMTAPKLFGGIDEQDPGATSADGFVPMAEGGTLLLHDIDQLSPGLQHAVSHLLETGSYAQPGTGKEVSPDVRVLASSSANLEAAVQAGALLAELYDQLAPVRVEMPSLRTRRSDIPLLARHFLELEAPGRHFEWSATCLEKLLLYDWPINIRELHNVMRRMTLVDDEVTTLRSAHLPKEIRKRVRSRTDDALRASAISVHVVPSRAELEELLARFGGDVGRLAEHYAKDRRHIRRWLSRHDLAASDFAED